MQQKLLSLTGAIAVDKLPKLPETMILDPISLAEKISQILLKLDIPYMVGGAVASSLWGEERSTQDLNLVINLQPFNLSPFVAAMSEIPQAYAPISSGFARIWFGVIFWSNILE